LADEPISMSWETSTKIISEADVVIREGTATFSNGEKAFLHLEGIATGSGESPAARRRGPQPLSFQSNSHRNFQSHPLGI